ncbi:MAG: transcription antiterminator [Oscillospiraceae bacterium]|jgi:mannitol operon transcriptional antiterminator|nr:transcription antiterminator [Oscillospiraceae bacterium]
MPNISPRLNQILRILLDAKAPVSVDRLSKALDTSRRTVFRELESLDFVLRETGLVLDTVAGAGMFLKGSEQARLELDKVLRSGVALPQGKRDRRALLAFLLLDAGEAQKLYYYASVMGVSEATVSLDMDALQRRFADYSLSLVRRQGAEVIGDEINFRRMITHFLLHNDALSSLLQRFSAPLFDALNTIKLIAQTQWLARIDWVTEESQLVLCTQLAVMIDRVKKQRPLVRVSETAGGLSKQLAGQICDDLEDGFSIKLSAIERTYVASLICACRAKQLNPLDIRDEAAYNRVQNLAFRMIDCFDGSLSPSLKLNEDLVDGLSAHLFSAIVRLESGLELPSAMREQMKRDFPEVFLKSAQAAKVLEQELGVPVPDSEVSFIAAHFGAALMHLGERSSRRLVLKAGIICVAGIGVSYMMASQVRAQFRGELEVSVCDWSNPFEWADFDLLISSIPLEYDRCPVICVSPILSKEDYSEIRDAVRSHVAQSADELPRLSGSLPERLSRSSAHFLEMSEVLRGYSRLRIHGDCSFDELAKMTGYRFGSSPEAGAQIYADLTRREKISSQVIDKLGIILLHARTSGVERPQVALVIPEGNGFTNPYFQGVRGGLLMLVPQDSGKDMLEVFGYISSSLIEDDVFLGAVQSGDEAVAYTRIESAMLRYLQNYWSDNLRR